MSIIKLDKAQQAIVDSNAKKICVVAGAGSGKTRVLTERVARLLKEGADPASMVCITFTKMAAQEMKSRLSHIPGYNNMFVGTIHSYANEMYKKATGSWVNLLTPEKEMEIVGDLIKKYRDNLHITLDKYKLWCEKRRQKELGFIKKKEMDAVLTEDEEIELYALLDYKDLRCLFSNMNDLTADELAEKALAIEKAARLSADFPETLRSVAVKQGLISFNELLDICQKELLLQRKTVKYLFVDEFQDIGVFEYRFLVGLNAENFFIVGDDFQAIYAFKGGCFEYFKSLANNPEFETHLLENNYRCNKKIVDYGDSIISKIHDVMPKKCVSKTNGMGQLILTEGGKNVVKRYVECIDKRDYGKWFILTRSNSDMIDISRMLYAMKIPSDTFKKGNLDAQGLDDIMKRNTIKVLTIHSAKGLENDNVILYGDFPENPSDSWWDYNGTEGMRIKYVGATRARNNLVVINHTWEQREQS